MRSFIAGFRSRLENTRKNNALTPTWRARAENMITRISGQGVGVKLDNSLTSQNESILSLRSLVREYDLQEHLRGVLQPNKRDIFLKACL